MLGPLARDRDHGLDVADAGGHANDDRHLVLLGQSESLLDHLIGFLGIRRLQHRHVAEAAPVAGILFVLRRGQTDIVGHHDHQTADYAGQRLGHEGIRGDVHADVFHGRQSARARQRRADSDFHRHFFVHRPFRIDIGIQRNVFQDFGGGSARIGGGDTDACLPGGARHRFVAREQMTAFGLGVNHGIHDDRNLVILFDTGVEKHPSKIQ